MPSCKLTAPVAFAARYPHAPADEECLEDGARRARRCPPPIDSVREPCKVGGRERSAALYLGPTPVEVAIRRCERLLEEGLDDLAGEASVSAHLGGLYGMACRTADAEALLRRARTTYTELGRGPSLLRTCAPIEARVAALSGDLESAAAIYLDACTQLKLGGGRFHLATLAAELADLLLELDRSAEAEEWCIEAERCARSDDVEGQAG